jgi:hypothetical protein
MLGNLPEIIPIFLGLIEDHAHPSIQFEAAWCVTNIACAEAKHVLSLVPHQAVPRLLNVIEHSNDSMVLNQCLWALCNMSSNIICCKSLVRDLPNALDIILSLIDIQVDQAPPQQQPPQNSIIGRIASVAGTKKLVASPSLSCLRHVAFILCNVVK